jgi:8-oxo-dGTP diphosphatase
MNFLLNFQKTMITVHGLIINDQGKMLIVKRADHDSRPGVWEMPGGTLEFGEDPRKGIVREVKEEVGLDVVTEKIITLHSLVTKGFIKKQKLRIAFLVKILNENQEVRLSHEHAEFKWVNPKDKIENISSFLVTTLEVYSKE